jgi:3-hydroxyisobutyrate dehydrogenase
MKVGFIGLGSQGGGIAQAIAKSSHDLVLWARRAASLDPFASFPVQVAASPRDLGVGLDVLGTCVFDAAGTREILFGPDGAAQSMPPGAVIVCHSTVAPTEIREIAQTAREEYGLQLLDAPVSGGGGLAASGQLVTMVGGEESVYDYCLPLLDTYSRLVVRLGDIGAGQQAKLINNTMLASHIGLAADAYQAATYLGLDPQALAKVLINSSGRSFGIEMLASIGSMGEIASSQARPTLSKDVALLDDTLGRSAIAPTLRTVARATMAQLAELGKPDAEAC